MTDEPHHDFMARIREMSSATYRPVGFENFRHSIASSMSTAGGLIARRSQRGDVLALVSLGRKDSEIADELGLSEDAVRTLRVTRM